MKRYGCSKKIFLNENFAQKAYGFFFKVKNWKFPQKALLLFSKKSNKLKNVLKKRYGPFKKSQKIINFLKKRYGPLKKSKKIENVFERHYGFSQNEVKKKKMSSKNVTVLLKKKSTKLKNFLKKHYGPWKKRKKISLKKRYGLSKKNDKCLQKPLRSF